MCQRLALARPRRLGHRKPASSPCPKPNGHDLWCAKRLFRSGRRAARCVRRGTGAAQAIFCYPVDLGQIAGGRPAYLAAPAGDDGGDRYAVIALSPEISYVEVYPGHGPAIKAKIVTVPGARFACFAGEDYKNITRAAYSGDGKRLATWF